MRENLIEKIKESLGSILPIAVVVLILGITFVPMTGEMFFSFFIGTVMLVVGMGLFTLGADTSMIVIGERIGSTITRSKNLMFILFMCFLVGFSIALAEPDLQVLTQQVPFINSGFLIIIVGVGTGVFLVISFLRIFLQIKISYLFTFLYTVVFILALLPSMNESYLPLAFDSGGVTTGPITVPFIIALGLGLASVRGDKTTQEDTFGLTGLCSIGPIVSVLLLSLFSDGGEIKYDSPEFLEFSNISLAFQEFIKNIPHYVKDISIALTPIIVFFIVFQVFAFKMDKVSVIKIVLGLVTTFIGLVLFMVGVNVGFMPVGVYLGSQIGAGHTKWLLIPLGMILGYFIVAAEPAVHVLKDRVEEITEGRITGRSITIGLSIGVSIAVGLSMLRVLTGLPLIWFLVPGYAFSLIMTFFVKPIFTAIAFDSGGVASGAMTVTFLLPFAMGASEGVGGNVALDAFGVVALITMTPLITIQFLGLIQNLKKKKEVPTSAPVFASEDDFVDEIINFDTTTTDIDSEETIAKSTIMTSDRIKDEER